MERRIYRQTELRENGMTTWWTSRWVDLKTNWKTDVQTKRWTHGWTVEETVCWADEQTEEGLTHWWTHPKLQLRIEIMIDRWRDGHTDRWADQNIELRNDGQTVRRKQWLTDWCINGKSDLLIDGLMNRWTYVQTKIHNIRWIERMTQWYIYISINQ